MCHRTSPRAVTTLVHRRTSSRLLSLLVVLCVSCSFSSASSSPSSPTSVWKQPFALSSRWIVTQRSLFRYKLHKLASHSSSNAAAAAGAGAGTNKAGASRRRLNHRQGSRLSFQKPTSETSAQCFDDSDDWYHPAATTTAIRFSTASSPSSSSSCFNHNTAGMTNPALHIAVDDTVVLHVSSSKTDDTNPKMTNTNTASPVSSSYRCWWPQSSSLATETDASTTSSIPTTPLTPTMTRTPNKHWRIVQYQRHLGYGRACYDAVRDQLLSWEFATPTQGIVAVPPPLRRRHYQRNHPTATTSGPTTTTTTTTTIPHRTKTSSSSRRRNDLDRTPATRTAADATDWTDVDRSHDYYEYADDVTSSDGPYDHRYCLPTSATAATAISPASLARRTRVYDDCNPYDWRSTASALRVGGIAQRFITYTRCCGGLLWCSNPVQVLYDIVDQRGPWTTYTSSAYGTTKGHWLAGEERLTVALRDADGQVQVQLLSYSKPNTIWTKLTWPLVQRMQTQFFESQLQCLHDVATAATAAAAQVPSSTTTKTTPKLWMQDCNDGIPVHTTTTTTTTTTIIPPTTTQTTTTSDPMCCAGSDGYSSETCHR